MEKRRRAGVRSAPSPRFPPPPGVGGAGAESAQPGRWMNVGENGDQDDRVRLGHVGGADGGKSGPPHPLPPATGGNLRPPPHKAGPELAAQEGRGRGGLFLTETLPPIFATRGAELSRRGRLQQFHLPADLDSLSRSANPLHLFAPAGLPTPFLSAPLCFPQHVRVPGFRPFPSLALESPTVHTRKWREGNRAPSPHPPTLILPIWKKRCSLLCGRNAVRVASPWFRGLRGSGSSLNGRKKDKRGERGG